MSTDPRWLKKARSYLGQKEIEGRQHNPQILKWWTLIRAGFTDDETPWCAGFVGGVLESVGITSSRSAAARSYLNWGSKLNKPVLGCITVFSRGTSNGHVAFYVGEDAAGNPRVLGGNQGNAVSIATYQKERVLGYRWPAGEPVTAEQAKPAKSKPMPVNPPDVEEPEPDEGGLSGKVKHWTNIIGTAAGGFLTALMSGDWRAVAAVAGVGFLIFCVIWFTHMRRNRK